MKMQQRAGIRVKVETPHDAGCSARTVQAGWGSGWYLTRDHANLDALGRNNRGIGHTWLIAKCNFGCKAKAFIHEHDVIDMLTAVELLPMRSGGTPR